MSKSVNVSDLVFRKDREEGDVWHCGKCEEPVHEQVEGSSIFWLVKAQKEHVCEQAAAEKRLFVDHVRLQEVLDEMGTKIEITWNDCGTPGLVLVDKRTKARLFLHSETLG